jgi:hypothetical protein
MGDKDDFIIATLGQLFQGGRKLYRCIVYRGTPEITRSLPEGIHVKVLFLAVVNEKV